MQKVKTFHKKHPVASTLIAVGLVGVLIGGGYGGFRYWQYTMSPEGIFQKEAKQYESDWNAMMKNAGEQINLPKDEVPVLATVTDKSALDKQKFFANAQEGDKIIMYKKHKIAYLYRPSVGKVITKATLNLVAPTAIPFESASVAGTSSSELEKGPVIEASKEGTLDKLIPQ